MGKPQFYNHNKPGRSEPDREWYGAYRLTRFTRPLRAVRKEAV